MRVAWARFNLFQENVSIARQSMTQLQWRCRSSQGLFDHLEFPDWFQFFSNYCRALRIYPKQHGWGPWSSHKCPFKTIPTCGSCSVIYSWTVRVALTLAEARWAGLLESWWLMWSSTTVAINFWLKPVFTGSIDLAILHQTTQTAP